MNTCFFNLVKDSKTYLVLSFRWHPHKAERVVSCCCGCKYCRYRINSKLRINKLSFEWRQEHCVIGKRSYPGFSGRDSGNQLECEDRRRKFVLKVVRL